MFRAYTFVRVFFVTSNAFFRQRFFRIYVVYCSCTRTVRVHVLLRTTKVRKYYYVYTYNAVDLHVTFVSYHTLFVQSSEPYVYVHVRVHVQRTNIFVEKVFSVASLSCTVRVHVHVRVVLYVIRKNQQKSILVTKNTYKSVRANTRARNTSRMMARGCAHFVCTTACS